ncbi:MAG: putative bifunctional diguanylate cyclase/phosphodiesterase [Aeromonadaceae bacterium]
MLDANQVSIWLGDINNRELVCSHVLDGHGRLGRVLDPEVVEALSSLLVNGACIISSETHPLLWESLLSAEASGYLLLADITSSAQWQGVLCCHRPNHIADRESLTQLLNQLSLLAGRGLDSVSQSQSEHSLLQRQQQLDRIAYALSSKTGRAFFEELVTQLYRVLQPQQVWLAEIERSPLASTARVVVSAGVESGFSRYPLSDSACGMLYQHPSVPFYATQAVILPAALMPADYYWALALFDSKQQMIGHLALTFSGLLPDNNTLIALQQLIVHRASAELERQRAEAELRLSAVAFETNEGIIITDPNLLILRVNHAFSHITGYDLQRVAGKRLGVEFWPWHHLGLLEFDENGRWQGEVERQRVDGSCYPQWETWSPVRDEQGEISHYVICFEDMSERKAAAKQIQSLAYYDDLTGLPNRRYLMEQVERCFTQARQHDMVGALLFIDLDHFKTINDSLGHATGDSLLQQVSARVARFLSGTDLLARLGGDEFVILLPALSSNPPQAEIQASVLAEELIAAISMPYEFEGQTLHIGASIGISLFPTRDQTPADLLKQADTAMYQAKAAGRRAMRLFDSTMQRQADRRLHIHNQLRNALNNNELLLHFQPQHMVDGGRLIGVEALLRWQPPGRGLISPAEFIPIAEETDLIIDIGQWVMTEACHQCVRWEEDGLHLPQLSVNVSAKQFHHPNFVEQVYEVLSCTGMEPSLLNLEITESVVLGNTEDTIHKMSELKQLGISFSIDDFGTGYSSLGYLKRLPVDELKIDRSFIQDIPHDTSNMAIVEAIMAMASHLNFNVTAEGVETRQQLEFLKKQGCPFYQGYLASKPLPPEHLAHYLRSQKPQLGEPQSADHR